MHREKIIFFLQNYGGKNYMHVLELTVSNSSHLASLLSIPIIVFVLFYSFRYKYECIYYSDIK